MKNASTANGGAMPAALPTRRDLIEEETGEVNLTVLKSLARREAMAQYRAICPKSLRYALGYLSQFVEDHKLAWRQRHGLPIETVLITPFGKHQDGVRRSAF